MRYTGDHALGQTIEVRALAAAETRASSAERGPLNRGWEDHTCVRASRSGVASFACRPSIIISLMCEAKACNFGVVDCPELRPHALAAFCYDSECLSRVRDDVYDLYERIRQAYPVDTHLQPPLKSNIVAVVCAIAGLTEIFLRIAYRSLSWTPPYGSAQC